jgi:hypothetical protein
MLLGFAIISHVRTLSAVAEKGAVVNAEAVSFMLLF